MKLILAALVAAAIQMVFGFLVWTMLSGALGIVRPLPDEEVARSGLREAATESGVYFLPAQGMGSEEWNAKHEAGPIAYLYLHPTGFRSNMGAIMAKGFVHFFLSGLILAWIVKLSGPAPTFIGRMKVVGWTAFFAAFAIHGADLVWWYAPTKFVIFAILATTAGWKLAGIAVAAMIKPATA